ncbi:phosphoserine phosphatase [Vibrio sp.]|uniref:Phosphoserine phosphatase n=1 Tax=Vibrio viridaestus TaxID=2487322 RepID=A0A3N9TGI7_9VIBR|nr:phosphoserine phosphatase [Vibrio viridaestus]MDC0609332.1 phosphoserine phosphatase [Vibrio sp.]RQW63014.1 phosphoserine phosphatase [Vibrio viridaestus]
MDALKTLPIHKHTSLIKRISRLSVATSLDRENANWIVFGNKLNEAHFECMDFYTGTFNLVVDAWKVGQYEVALMAGNLSPLHEEILQTLELDYADIWDVPDLTVPGLVLMDMDSTAIQIECIDEIAKLAGVGDEVAEVTERAMQGELDFEQSLRQRVGKLAGADESILEQVRSTLPFMPDLEALVATLKALGWKAAIASGGFTYFSDFLKETLSLDYAQSNTLEIVDGKLTGKVLGDVVSAQTKADILVKLAQDFSLPTSNTVAVGDGANDLVMMEAAGLGIAYHAKPKVEARAQTSVRFSALGGVLCILSAGLAKQGKLSWQKRA